ncbi:iron chelate uptake ABC transporter family permease subunit [Thermoflexus sp.]|uniref:metal ABC transporter permease n=1 Tax=Thermoflexus sp. TaxID=1969742 RepID=UPI0025D4F338|nr:iron chelate uptake ABC transporter family permease subunit [Thermoflexus sp.]MCS6963122.1 metal ABC transporter permease [Thermoflexus sp.]MCX7690480.1 metal ABC transporter permease [Thermoflexus sp.]MDW8185142.1 iron chelate uptake ABC transporter family permease subunit [Anaerolineae bacterium]
MGFAFWLDPTFRLVAVGSALIGAVGGVLGTFALLRRQSLLGDAMSHAALPGIVLAFLLAGSRDLPLLLAGASLSAWLGALLVVLITHRSRIRPDAALGLVLSVFFGFGIVLLTVAQRQPTAAQAGLERFLFGQAAMMLRRDVEGIALATVLILVVVLLLWKEFKVLAFDPAFAAAIGLPVMALDVLLTTLIVLAIALGLHAVGVVLMSAVLVAPAAAARQWTHRLERMVILAGGFGALSGVLGTLLSSWIGRLPTGPMIALCASGIALFSLLFAPHRGLIWTAKSPGGKRDAGPSG